MIEEWLVLPDIHWERHNKPALKAIFRLIEDRRPNVVQLGDLYTLDQFSRYRKDPRMLMKTMDTVKSSIEEFWGPLHGMLKSKKDPKQIWFTLGNHEQRMYDYCVDNASVLLDLFGTEEVPYADWLGFGPYVDQWCTYGRGLVRGNVVFTHGNRVGATSAKNLLTEDWGMNGMSGHTHKATRFERRTFASRQVWQECGVLGDLAQWYNDADTTDWHSGFGYAQIDPAGWELPQLDFIRVDEKQGWFKFWGQEYGWR